MDSHNNIFRSSARANSRVVSIHRIGLSVSEMPEDGGR